MGFQVREATNDDVPGIVACISSVYDEYGFTWEAEDYHADLYDPEAHYMAKGHTFWVAEQGGEVVGTGALERFPTVEGNEGELVQQEGFVRIAGCDCALQRLYVPAMLRKSGIGTALFLKVLETAREEGRRAMEIWSDKRFQEAHRLYERHGATIAGDRICHDPDQSPEWGLILRLGGGDC